MNDSLRIMREFVLRFIILYILCLFSTNSFAQPVTYAPRDMYWTGLGATTNWSNLNNWSESPTQQTNVAVVPTSVDNVYFTEHVAKPAGYTVSVDVAAICNSFIVTGGKTPNFTGAKISLYGNLDLEPDTRFIITKIDFWAGGAATIKSSNVQFDRTTFEFNSPTGVWTLLDDLNDPSITFNSGRINTNNKSLLLRSVNSNSDLSRTWDLGSSEMLVKSTWRFEGANTNLIAGTSHFILDATSSDFLGVITQQYHKITIKNRITIFSYGIRNITADTIIGENNTNEFLQTVQAGYVSLSSDKATIRQSTINNLVLNGAGIINYSSVLDSAVFKKNVQITYHQTETSTINRAIFYEGATLGNNFIINEATFTRGKTYSLQREHSSQVNINRRINAIKFRGNTSCSDYTIITSSNPRLSQPMLQYGGPPLHLERTMVRGLDLSGNLTAEVDAGRNTNWTFVHPAAGTTYYWVGGKGEWTDVSHWASSSGGLRGSGCIPGVTDKVVVDENSGLAANDSITLYPFANTKDELSPPRIAVCAGIEFRNLSDSLDFYIPFFFVYGDMVLHPKLRYQLNIAYSGYYGIPNTFFMGGGTITVNKARIFTTHTQGSAFFIDGGSWTLIDDLKIDGNIEFNQGSFNTNGHKLEIDNFLSDSGLPRSLSLGNSQVYVKKIWRYNYTANSAIINAGTSHIHMLNINDGVTTTFSTIPTQLYRDITFYDGTTITYYGGHSTNVVEFFSPVSYQSPGGTNKTLSFHKDVALSSTTTTDTLIFNKPLKITYSANVTLTVNDSVINKLDGCSGTLSFSPTRDIYRLTFASPKAVRLNYVYLKNVTGRIGGGGVGPYTAMGIDGGGNQNWTFVPMTVRDFYWIGGQGNWDQMQHWSLSPGGASANCLPGRFDNVYFNENSGLSGTDTVYVSGTDMIAECRDMTWNNVAGTPVFANGNLSTINIYGSYTLQAGMHYNVETTLVSSNDKSVPNILKGNSVVLNNLIMQEANTKLADKLFTSNRVSVDRTTFDTDGHDMDIYRFWAVNASNSNVFLRSSEIVLRKDTYTVSGTPNDTSSTWYFPATALAGTNNILDAGTSHIITRGLFVGGHVVRYNNITFEPSALSSVLRGAVYINTLTSNNPIAIDYFNTKTIFRTINDASLLKGSMLFNYSSGSATAYNHGGGTINKLLLGSGFTYYFPVTTDTLYIGEMTNTAQGDCYTETIFSGMTWYTGPEVALIKIANPSTMDRITVTRVNNHGIPATLRGSFSNLYRNMGWVYADSPGRTLYWVGGGGMWDDESHWSLAPGGAGGQCIPTPWDDVIFDDESGFTSGNRTIKSSKTLTGLVRDLSFKGTSNPAIFGATTPTFHINVHGSLYLQQGMKYPIITRFRSIKPGNTITSNGVLIGSWEFNSTHFGESTASWTLMDDIAPTAINISFTHKAGELNFNGKKVVLSSFHTYAPDAQNFEPRTLNIENSVLQLSSTFTYLGQNIKTNNSRIQFTSTGSSFKSGYNLSYDTIVNSNTTNNTMEGGFNVNVLKLNGGTKISGSNNFNKLYLAKQSHVVTFEADSTQTINSIFSVSGSPCHVSKIYSSSNTVPAKLSLPYITTIDYVEFRGINATDKKIVAERNSDNGGNNTNITFIEGTGGLVGLGGDTTLCNNGFPYTLGTSGFFPGPEAEFEWFDSKGASLGKTGTINVFKPGKYSVKVDYKSTPVNCIRYDTIEVTASAPIAFVTDYDIVHPECLRDSAVITIKSPLGAQYSYAMQDTAVSTPLVFQTNPVLERGKAGVYYLVVKEGECTSDSVIIKIREPYIPGIPANIVINDTTTCSGYSIDLSPTTTTIGINPTFHWYADAGLTAPITAGVSAEGVLSTPILTGNTTYYVTISSDTLCENPAGQAHAVQITVTPSPVIDALSANTVSCTSNNGEIIISASGGIAPYRYSVNNGISWSLSNIIGGLAMGSYTVVVEDAGGCKSIPQPIILEGGVTSDTAARSYSDSPLAFAEHRLKGCLYLGALDTLEIQAILTPSIFANTALNDDGVSVPVTTDGYTDLSHVDFLVSADGSLNVKTQVSNFTANVAQAIGWIDFNKNGIFDPTEASVAVPIASGSSNSSISLVWAGAANNISVGANYLRVRLSSAPFNSANATGELPDGEVEDYRLDFMPYSLSKMSEVNNVDYHSLDTARIGDTISYKLTVVNNLGVDIVIDKLFDTISSETTLHDTYPMANSIVGHHIEWINIALLAGADSTFVIRTIATDIPQPDSIIYNIAYAVRGNDTINSVLNCDIDSLFILPMPIDANDDCMLTLKNEAVKMHVIVNDTIAPDFGIVIRNAAQNGIATVDMSDSTILYTPNVGYIGLDSMMYSLTLNGIERDSAMVRIAVVSLAGDFSFCPGVDTVVILDTISGVYYKWYNQLGNHQPGANGKYNNRLPIKMGTSDTIFYISANYGYCDSTNKIGISVRIDSLRKVPDIRIFICPNPNQQINLASYLDTVQFKSVTWTPRGASPVLHGDTLYTEYMLGLGNTIGYNYSVTTHCGVSRAAMFIQAPKSEASLPKGIEVRVCYLHADNLQLKPILGLEGKGVWTYDAALAPFVKKTKSGAYVFDGKLYYGTGPGTGDMSVEFTYTPTATNCYTGLPIVVKIILTEDIL